MTAVIRANTTTIAGTMDNLPICQMPITFHKSSSNKLDHTIIKEITHLEIYVNCTYNMHMFIGIHSYKILLTSIALNQFQYKQNIKYISNHISGK